MKIVANSIRRTFFGVMPARSKSVYSLPASLSIIHMMAVVGLALDPHTPIAKYVHRSWTSDETTLETSTFFSMLVSRDGYLWAASEAGVVRFDGFRFTTLRPDNTPGLKSGFASSLLEDDDGSLWVGTFGGGLSRIHRGHATTYTKQDGLIADTIFSLCGDKNGIWIGFAGGGVQRLYKGKFDTYSSGLLGSSGAAYAMALDHKGGLWIFLGESMIRMEGRKIDRYAIPGSSGNNGSQKILVDHQGSVWVATQSGLYRFFGNHFSPYDSTLLNEPIVSIAEDKDGALWLGTTSGLKRLLHGKLESFTAASGLSGDAVQALLFDGEGDLWAASLGLDYFRDPISETISRRNGLPGDVVWSASEDATGSLWIGTEGGLAKSYGKTVQAYTIRNGLPANLTYCTSVDHEGTVWFGGSGWAGSMKHGQPPPTIIRLEGNNEVHSVFETSAGTLLFGCTRGIRQFSNGHLHPGPADLPLVHSLFEAPDKHIWVSTVLGLFKMTDGAATRYGSDSDDYFSSYVDRDRTTWVVSEFGGLVRVRDERVTRFNNLGEKLRPPLYAVFEDDANNLWFTSSHGLLRVSKQDLNDYGDGKIQSKDVLLAVFSRSDGLPTTNFSGGVQNTVGKRRDGTYWLASEKGLVLFDPHKVKREPLLPTIIENVLVDDRPILDETKLRLSPKHQRIEFDYTAVAFHNFDSVQFFFKLQGFDSDWMLAGGRRNAIYTRLRHGSYRFRVKACNRDGVCSEAASFAFSVDPSVYETPAFYSLCTIFGVILSFSLYKWRVLRVRASLERILEERVAERTRVAYEVHDTLLQGVAGAAMMLKATRKNIETSKAREDIDNVIQEIQKTMTETRRTLWEKRPADHDTGWRLEASLESYAKRLASAVNIKCTFVATSNSPRLTAGCEADLLRVGKEAVLNAVKHSHASELRISVDFTDDSIILTVEDNGTGFHSVQSLIPGHWGLAVMQERVQRWGGTIVFESRKGGGTIVRAILPYRSE